MNRSIFFLKPALLLCALLASGNVLAESHAACPHDNNEACMHKQGKCEHGKYKHCRGKHGYRNYGPRSGAGMEAMRERMNKLGLSEQQKQDMAALMQVYGPRLKEIAERGKESREALIKMAPDAEGYNSQVEAVSREAGNSAAEVVTLMGELQANAYALLTPEQQAEYQALKEKMREKREQWRAKRAEARKGSSGKGCLHTARPGCERTQGAPETPP